jgi:hypothetical protein
MPSTLERAIELAKSGEFKTVEDIRRRLTQERYPYVIPHLRGSLIRRQLRVLLKASPAAEDEHTAR